MIEAMIFMMGFGGIISAYEVAKAAKSNKGNSIRKDAERLIKQIKK